MNGHSLMTLAYEKIKEGLRTYATSGLGKRMIDDLRPLTDPRAVEHNLRETTEARAILDAAGHIPLHGLSDVTEHMERVGRGAVLDPCSLEEIADFLYGCRKTAGFMTRYREIAPQVAGYAQAITVFEDVEDDIGRCIENARVSSAASVRLAKVRAQSEIVKSRLKDKMNSFLTSGKYRECLQEALITIKDGRYCLSVKASQRHQLDGMVIAASGSGQTVFFEPAVVRNLTNELKVLQGEEEAEEYQVLYRLTGEIALRQQAIHLNLETMAVYDLACAKAKYSKAMDGIPAALAKGERIVIRRGRHPLLGKGAVPLDFYIGTDYRTLLITGPNTGGKTVALKTIGLFALMTQSGLHIPAERGTEIGVFQHILVDIGDQQSIAQSLSTFSGHIKNLIGILETAGRGTLVLIDEIGTGTDPAEGAALAAAILDALCAAGAVTIATTHYGDLKRFSDAHLGFRNGCMEFDPETLAPLYLLKIGRAGRSNGLWIAERLGMRAETLNKARGYLNSGNSSTGVREAEVGSEDNAPSDPLEPETPAAAATEISKVPIERRLESSAEFREGDTEAGEALGPTAERPFQIGDSVYVGTVGENGILCAAADARGDVVVLVREKKIKVNQKRIKLHIAREQLYPDVKNYDLNIVLMSKDDRRLVKQMQKRHIEGRQRIIKEESL